ncbi:MAG: BatD family protein [Leptospira sp.]|nr:BatD family protein [Leptospira sp.]
MKGVFYTIFIFLVLVHPIFSTQIEFLLSSQEVGKGEPLIIEARVEGKAAPKPTKKVFSSGSIKAIYSGIMTETKIINFKASTYTTLRFSIIHSTPGKYKIPPIAVDLNGKIHTIPETHFTVSNKKIARRVGSFPGRFSDFHEEQEDLDMANLSLKFQTSKSSVYVGEPVIGYFILYSKSPRKLNFERNPNSSISFPFFTSELLQGVQISYPEQVDLQNESKNQASGTKFYTHPYNREIFALTPLKRGNYKLGSTKFDIVQPMSFRFESETLDVQPQHISVKDLPSNPPSSFSGEVGDYELTINYEGTETTQGNPWRFVVTIKGTGLCNRIKDPILDIVPKNFPGKIISLGVDRERKFSEIENNQFGFLCEAKFRYSANINSNSRSFPAEVSFFQSEAGEYVTKKITVPAIKVLPNSKKQENEWDAFDYSQAGPLIPWLKLVSLTGLIIFAVSGFFFYKTKIQPGITMRNRYLANLDKLAGNKSGLLLERILAKSLSEEEAKFWRNISEKYTNKNFTKIYSLLDYKEREIFETWLNKEKKNNE